MSLSKSRYCKGIQCPKILWLDEYKSEARDDSGLNQQIFDTGSKVGDLAMGYYGAYTEVTYNDDKSLMLAQTRRLLDERTAIICEASFSYNGNFCSVDILRVFDCGVEIVEVKSSTDLKPIYYDDVAFQYYVLTSCGLNVTRISVMHINNNYERQGELDLHGLFVVRDCTEKVRSMQDDVAVNITRFKKFLTEKTEPVMDIGGQCRDPYNCLYRTYCWRHLPENNVFAISGQALRFDKKLDLYRRGIVSFEQLLESADLQSGEELNAAARLQAETLVYKRPPSIDMEAIRAFLNTLSWPLYFLDFETFREAVPPYAGIRPYMQVPFQYSLHVQEAPGAAARHLEFLAEEGTDPRRCLAERLCADIPRNVCVIAYNMSFEKSRIRELADFLTGILPEASAHLMNIHDNFKDLMQPFQARAYYSGQLGGSYSIKKVLPALCPDFELGYSELDLVHNGTEAQSAYARLCEESGPGCDERQRIRTALLAYCCLDTLAMMKILEKLITLTEWNS